MTSVCPITIEKLPQTSEKREKKPRDQSFHLTQYILSPVTAEIRKKLFYKTEEFLRVPDIQYLCLVKDY